jgi:hypothetical protein
MTRKGVEHSEQPPTTTKKHSLEKCGFLQDGVTIFRKAMMLYEPQPRAPSFISKIRWRYVQKYYTMGSTVKQLQMQTRSFWWDNSASDMAAFYIQNLLQECLKVYTGE